MNPFLIGATILVWCLFLFAYLLSAITNGKNNYICDAFIFLVIGIFLTIACGASWQHLHDTPQLPALEQHK
jgi:hypothetical protein